MKWRLFAVILFCPLFCKASAVAQTVITLPVTGLNGPNGFAIDKSGRLYIANEPGKQVTRLLNDSTAETVLSCDSPDGLAFDKDDNLFISNFFSGTILRIKGSAVDTFAKNLDKPADIKFDSVGNLFVAEYETGNIKKINRGGDITLFASGFKNPFGLAFDTEGNLYVANNVTGIINKVNPGGATSIFARIPGSIAYLTYSQKTKRLYAACFSCHAVYAITKKGEVIRVVGFWVPRVLWVKANSECRIQN